MKSQIDEEYATEAPSSGFDEREVKECNLPGMKKQKIHRSNSKSSKKKIIIKIKIKNDALLQDSNYNLYLLLQG